MPLPLNDLDRWEEVLNGRIIKVEPSSFEIHQKVTHNILKILENYLENKECRVYGSGVGVSLTDNDNFIPDAMVISNLEIIKSDGGVYGAPDLIAEVLSDESESSDRGYKKQMYEKHGTKELWLVCPKSLSIEVYHLIQNKFKQIGIYEYSQNKHTSFKLSILNNLEIKLEDIFINCN